MVVFKVNSASVMMHKTKTDKRASQAQLARRLLWLRLLVSDELAGRLAVPPLRNCSLMMIEGGWREAKRGGGEGGRGEERKQQNNW